MSEITWAQQAVNGFFEGRQHPTQAQCDRIAQSVSGASTVRNVDTPGSTSYTVVCTGHHTAKQDLVVSFREPEAYLDPGILRLARAIHGSVVPEASQHGMVEGADPPLAIYMMPYLPGISCLDALGCEVEADDNTVANYVCFIKHLAGYFARCWSAQQHTTAETQVRRLRGMERRLALLMETPSVLDTAAVLPLQQSLPLLFAPEYPQVLTHGDLSKTNILIDANTYEITGIVDWSLASVLPFGMELDSLYLMTGYMDRGGWHDYACRSWLHDVFWDTFWHLSGIKEGDRQREVRDMAERAARIGAVLRYAFRRNADGSPSEVPAPHDARAWSYLHAWLAT
ncbi:Protein kinase-like domain protein [Niveomyces insectorum RCEF 264]|uniref:Protein kinase-like domain protein n=1 Tax=Niveomyces insectorum RCEF 264 TaxID=1081102 RepID=A0A167SFC0_9HYPO|nr:Protein kinase-like domain protein [Niveomyces insectorum RCEF 264]